MPPVREASTKPSAATVLPAPVACSNQKRRAAPGVLLLGVGGGLLLGLLGRVPVERLLVGQLVALDLDLAGVELLGGGLAVAVPGAADQELGLERDQRAGEGIDLVSGERRAVHEMRLVLGEQPLKPEDQRVVAPPLDGGLAAPLVDLLQRGVERDAARAVLRERGGGVLSFEYERFTREFLGALQFFAGNRRGFGHGASFSHGKAVLSKGKACRAARSGVSGERPSCAAAA